MNEYQWFVVGARLIGLWVLTWVVSDLRTLIDIWLGWVDPAFRVQVYILATIEHAAVGLFLLLAAHHLARFVCCRPAEVLDNDRPAPGRSDQ